MKHKAPMLILLKLNWVSDVRAAKSVNRQHEETSFLPCMLYETRRKSHILSVLHTEMIISFITD